jgi:translation elongation factor EF-G
MVAGWSRLRGRRTFAGDAPPGRIQAGSLCYIALRTVERCLPHSLVFQSLRARKFRLILERMAGHRSAEIRNFAVVGHASSGKTILSEAMLACSGTVNRMGRIAEGTTVSDYKKQSGGAGQFAQVLLRITPAARDTGIRFTESLTGQSVDRVYVPSVERGVQHACSEGILAGYRVVDVNVNFYDGKMHPVDSNDISFQVAGYWAFKEAFLKARPCLLEPIHSLDIRVPEDCVGKVIGDLSSRRGKVVGMEAGQRLEVVRALVPAKELYRYASQLRSLAGGRGLHTEEFSHYEELPPELEQNVIESARKARSNH